MKSDATRAPVIQFTPLTNLLTADPLTIKAREQREGELLADADLSGVDLAATIFLGCELASLTLTETKLRGARFAECLITGSFAPLLSAARTTWRDTRIENPRWGSAELFESEWASTHIRGGKIDYLNLRTSKLTNVLLEGCTIGELDLSGVNASRVALRDCSIGTLDVTRARLADVDIRTSRFSTIVGLEGLRGATIDDGQLMELAGVLATHVGLRVEN